jgi:hypothetical protein
MFSYKSTPLCKISESDLCHSKREGKMEKAIGRNALHELFLVVFPSLPVAQLAGQNVYVTTNKGRRYRAISIIKLATQCICSSYILIPC